MKTMLLIITMVLVARLGATTGYDDFSDLSVTYVVKPGLLPPKAIDLEPDLPVWSPPDDQVVVAPETKSEKQLPVHPLSGALGFLFALLGLWFKNRMKR